MKGTDLIGYPYAVNPSIIVPELKAKTLVELMATTKRNPKKLEEGLRELVDAGILSFSGNGNYKLWTRMDPHFQVSPYLDGKVLLQKEMLNHF